MIFQKKNHLTCNFAFHLYIFLRLFVSSILLHLKIKDSKPTFSTPLTDSSREWGKCYRIIKGVCEGLQYLHNERIVRSDLKPANILLDDDMVPKIADFGISRCFDEKQTHTVTSKIVGTE